MKKLTLLLLLAAGCVSVKAENGDRPARDSNQKVTRLEMPLMEATITYLGGDTLFLAINTEDMEVVNIKLLGGSTTLLNDKMQNKQSLNRTYIISQLPAGNYKIQLKKGNYVVEKTFTKITP